MLLTGRKKMQEAEQKTPEEIVLHPLFAVRRSLVSSKLLYVAALRRQYGTENNEWRHYGDVPSLCNTKVALFLCFVGVCITEQQQVFSRITHIWSGPFVDRSLGFLFNLYLKGFSSHCVRSKTGSSTLNKVTTCQVFVFSCFSSALPVLFCQTLLSVQTTSCLVSLLCDYLPRPNVMHLCLIVFPPWVYLVCVLSALCASSSLSQVFKQFSWYIYFFFLTLIGFSRTLPFPCLCWLTSCVPNLPGY